MATKAENEPPELDWFQEMEARMNMQEAKTDRLERELKKLSAGLANKERQRYLAVIEKLSESRSEMTVVREERY